MSIENEIIELIKLRHEGSYWDFKKQWHEDKGSLVHDIICFANNLVDKDCYIIIGIDESDNYTVVDVTNNTERKNTSQLVNMFSNINFGGGVRPDIYVESLTLGDKIIDVIVIKNSFNTPYVLVEDYPNKINNSENAKKQKQVKANIVYTRVQENNTAIDKSADINHIELLWKKRFRIDKSPVEKLKYYLEKTDNWIKSPYEMKQIIYYKNSPEYNIEELRDERDDLQVYHLFMEYPFPEWGKVFIKYHQTLLMHKNICYVDGEKVVAPDFDSVLIGCNYYMFYYIDKDSDDYLIYNFYKERSSEKLPYYTYEDYVFFFDNEIDRTNFIKYVKNNKDEFLPLIIDIPLYTKNWRIDENTLKKQQEYMNIICALKKMKTKYDYEKYL